MQWLEQVEVFCFFFHKTKQRQAESPGWQVALTPSSRAPAPSALLVPRRLAFVLSYLVKAGSPLCVPVPAWGKEEGREDEGRAFPLQRRLHTSPLTHIPLSRKTRVPSPPLTAGKDCCLFSVASCQRQIRSGQVRRGFHH